MDADKAKLLESASSAYKEEFKTLTDIRSTIDTKAQGVITTSGIFLAGVFAFLRQLVAPVDSTVNALIIASAILLTASVLASLFVLWARSFHLPPRGETVHGMVTDILDATAPPAGHTPPVPPIPEDVCLYFYYDNFDIWKSANSSLKAVNERKAIFLFVSQLCLGLAVLASIFLLFVRF